MAQFPTVGRFICGGPQLLSDLYGAVPDCREIYMRRSTATQVAQFPTVGGFILWLLSNLYGVVPDCREISMWQSTATQQTTWHRWRSSRLSGDSIRRSTATQQFTWRSSRLSGDFYAAVHSYSAIYMAQFPTVGRFIYGGPQLLSNLHGTVPDCREIYMRRSTATQ